MEASQWFVTSWPDFIDCLTAVGLLLTAYQIRKEAQARRISNLIAINDQHSKLWAEMTQNPKLARIPRPDVDLQKEPVSDAEWHHVKRLILLLDTSHRARRARALVNLSGLPMDIRQFFSLPIPKIVWKELQIYQDPRFVKFVEKNRRPV